MTRNKEAKGMEGWTSTGLSDDASEQLDKIAKDLGINKREACSIAINHFTRSDGYKAMKELSRESWTTAA